MIFRAPQPDDSIDQGDLIDECPISLPTFWDLDRIPQVELAESKHRVIVLTQTCDLANSKTEWAVVAPAISAQPLIDQGILTKSQVRDQVRAGRVFGWYYLPKSDELGVPELIIDLRQLHTVRLDMLRALCMRGHRKARLQTPYREHLNQHFATTYSRIGLPQPYPTD